MRLKLRASKPKIVTKKIKKGSSIIEMKGITKRFSNLVANDNINFEVKKGEIHALLGENGAGKSTLMKILFGLYRLDKGKIFVKGMRIKPKSPKDVIKMGLGMVQQHFALVPPFTVTENIILGLKSAKEPLLDLNFAEEQIIELSKKFGLKVNPKAEIRHLSIGEQQRVEILKALYRKADILILDEPTAVLTPQEVKSLFKTLQFMVEQGLTIIFITHKLPEVFAVSNRVTVLRDGKVMATVNTKETKENELNRFMFGKEVCCLSKKIIGSLGKVVLETKDLSVLGDNGLQVVRNISFQVRAGEILGIAGVAGNGQRELVEAIAGLRKVESGQIFVMGEETTNRSPSELINLGVAYIPEDRMTTGMVMDFNICENSILTVHSKLPFSTKKGGFRFLNKKKINSYCDLLISDYNVKTSSRDAPTHTLSGGNIQRLILAREISRNPKILIANKPTRGLDIDSAAFIQNKLLEEKKKKVGMLLISEDLEEIMCLSDRIVVIYEGRIVGIVKSTKANYEKIGLMMTGITNNKSKKSQF